MASTSEGALFGTVRLTVDADSGTVDVGAVRTNTAIGDAFLVGLNQPWEDFRITSIRRVLTADSVQLIVSTAYKHPFEMASRPDLMGWDLKAILATDHGAMTFDDAGVTLPVDLLANAAGYTGEWTPEIRSALPGIQSDVFPYIILGEDRTAPVPFDYLNPAGYNNFAPGSTATGDFVLNLQPGDVLECDMFFTVGYHIAATKTTRQNPEYEPPRGNSRAPWRVSLSVGVSDLGYGIGTSADLTVYAWDWQHAEGAGSQVSGFRAWAPELFAGTLTPPVGSGNGRDVDPVQGTFPVINELGTLDHPRTPLLVEVDDSLSGNNPGGQAGSPGVTVLGDDFTSIRTIDDFRTFQVLMLSALPSLPGADPIPCVSSDPPMSGGSLQVRTGTTVRWDASCSTDPDSPTDPEGTIVKWEWDTEWDGVPANFVDETGGTGTATIAHDYTTAGDTHLGLRLTDGVGRVSGILDVPVTVTDRILTLVLDPIVDVELPTWMVNDQREMGACFTQLSDGRVELNYTAEELSVGAPGFTSYQLTSYYTPGDPGTWSRSGTDLSSSGLGALEYGFWLKNCTNWGPSGEGIVLWGFTYRDTHDSAEVLYAHNVFLGTLGLVTDIDASASVSNGYGFDLASSHLDGSVYVFICPPTSGEALQVQKGGPDKVGTPLTDWRLTYPTHTIDDRPSHVSRVKSTDAAPTGDLHLAYLDAEHTALRYARNASGDGTTWELSELSTGEYGDPAFALGGDDAAYVAVPNHADGVWFLELYASLDRGVTWQAPIILNPPGSGLGQLSMNVGEVEGNRILAIGYSTSDALNASGESRVVFSDDGGFRWTDQLVSTDASTHWPDQFIARDTSDFFAAWSVDDLPNEVNMQAVHGVFRYE